MSVSWSTPEANEAARREATTSHLRPVVADKDNLTLRERMVLAHERGELHNGEACPTCIHGQFMYRLGEKAAIRVIAEGA